MSEGWSDYISCTVNDSAVVGAWLKAKPTGIRSNPYNDAYPFRFGNLGKGDFTAGNPHLIGEIWAATLLEIDRKTDKNLVAQLVVDSLKLLAANPGFLDGRNAMFEALFYMWAAGLLSDNQFWGAWQTMWKVFCKYGMGPYASSNGAQLEGIVASSELGQPDWRRCSQCRVLYFGLAPTKCPKSGGGHTQAGTANYELVNDWPDHPGDSSWKYCYQCGGLFSSGGVSKCPATTTAHDDLQSGAYALLFDVVPSPGDAMWRDTAWRKCAKCGGLVWTGVAGVSPECPGGGLHSVATANKYSLVFN
jgi:hypothetical protein